MITQTIAFSKGGRSAARSPTSTPLKFRHNGPPTSEIRTHGLDQNATPTSTTQATHAVEARSCNSPVSWRSEISILWGAIRILGLPSGALLRALWVPCCSCSVLFCRYRVDSTWSCVLFFAPCRLTCLLAEELSLLPCKALFWPRRPRRPRVKNGHGIWPVSATVLALVVWLPSECLTCMPHTQGKRQPSSPRLCLSHSDSTGDMCLRPYPPPLPQRATHGCSCIQHSNLDTNPHLHTPTHHTHTHAQVQS